MLTRVKLGLKRTYKTESQGGTLSSGAVAAPRLWIILLVLALPFFSICVDYFEALEQTGTLGATIADTTLPAFLVGYVVLVVVLKKRRI